MIEDESPVVRTAEGAAALQTPLFFPLSKRKLVIMSLATFGLYAMWWSFKNWLSIEQQLNKKMVPGARAFFGLLFVYPMLKEIRLIGETKGSKQTLKAGLLATGYILLSLAGRLPDPVWLVAVLTFLPLLPAQDYINNLNLQLNPEVVINDKLTKGNWIAIVIGGCFTLLVILATIAESVLHVTPPGS